MTWDPTIPATNADLVSAPVRGNFQALDTALMAPVIAAPLHALLTVDASDVLAGIAPVAIGAVLASAGVTTAPTWSVSPALTDLKLGGGTIGTSGVGVLALGPSTAPTTSPVDTVQLYTLDLGAEAGSRGLVSRDERGGLITWGTVAGGPTYQRMTNLVGVVTDLRSDPTTAWIGSTSNHPTTLGANSIGRMTLATNGDIAMDSPQVTVGKTGAFGKTLTYSLPSEAIMRLNAVDVGGRLYDLVSTGTGSAFGSPGTFVIVDSTGSRQLISWDTANQLFLRISGGSVPKVVGALGPDSAGAGYRYMIIAN